MIWLVEWEKIIVRHVHYFCYRCIISAERQCKFFKFVVLTTTRSRSCKFFIISLCMRTICANQVKGHFAHVGQPDQTWNNRKKLNLPRGSVLKLLFRCSSCNSFLNSPKKDLYLITKEPFILTYKLLNRYRFIWNRVSLWFPFTGSQVRVRGGSPHGRKSIGEFFAIGEQQ